MEKENNRVILVNDDESDKKGIGIITSSTRTIESIKKIKKTYIKYGGRASIIDDSGKNVIVEFIEFNSMPIDILKSITEEISEKIKDENISIEEMLEFIFDLFSTHRLERDYEKKLIGDLGEAIFMIEAKNNGINADQMIRKEDNSLYDFVFGKTYVEVKTSSKYQNEIKITERQISESNDRVIVVSNFQKLEDKLNIIDLYKILNSSNPLILEKKAAYENDFNDQAFAEVMRNFTVDLDNTEVFILEDNVLPKIEIKHRGGLKEISYTVDITKTNRTNISDLKKYL